MSAETLRRAATNLRREISADREPFYGAIADWLDECADIKAAPDVNAGLKIALTDRAIKVARAYLGES